ncbi:MAG: hypothetical protein H6937_03680 [Burkholderiales bacterium]|nr:hypothetical protein [Burkholderiales bacterium]MDR4518676.1 hypothetical protein [Nitrosomonas sp.]
MSRRQEAHQQQKWKEQLIEQSSEVFATGNELAPDKESEIQCKRRWSIDHGK